MPRLRLDPTSPSGISIAPDDTPRQSYGYVSNKATGLITAGSNITLSGNGTDSSPYVINSTASGGGGVSDGDKGDITVSGSGAVWTIDSGLDAAKLGTGTVSNTELGYLDGVTSAVQTQLDNKVSKTGTETIGGAKTFTSPVAVSGANGVMTLSSDTDGGQYNIGVSVSGKLAIYGAAGATLDLNLLDGGLYTNTTLRLSNAGVLQNTDLTGTGNTFPTFNQSTTGTAGNITGTLAVAQGGTGATTTTGTGANVLATSPTLVTPALGTPASGVLTNATGLPISTGVAGLGTGVATFLATPSSANLATAVTDETGTGALVFGTSPTLATPSITYTNNSVPAAALATSAIKLGYAQTTTLFTSTSTTAVQVTGLAASVTIPAGGRSIKITAFAQSLYANAVTYMAITIWDGTVGTGTQLARAQFYQSGTTAASTAITCYAVVTPAAGAKTYNMGFQTSAGTGNVESGATFPSFILVEAI